ncbi:MAG: SAF domain-containing protein [Kineosporiaceae bacterium]
MAAGAVGPGGGAAGGRWVVGATTRRVPRLVVGVVLVVGCVAAFYVWSLQASGRLPVLALARDVTAGQVLTEADLRVVRVATGPDVASVPASQRAEVIGRPVALPGVAGTLLTPDAVGSAAFPDEGQGIAAVAVTAGQHPPSLTVGSRVAVLRTTTPTTPATPATPAGAPTQPDQATGDAPASGDGGGDGDVVASGQVLTVDADPTRADGARVVSLLLSEADALRVGAAPVGSLSLVQLSATADPALDTRSGASSGAGPDVG